MPTNNDDDLTRLLDLTEKDHFPTPWVGLVSVLAVVLLLSYGLACAGEPSSAWLWRDVLGVL